MNIFKIYKAGLNKETNKFECVAFEMQRFDEHHKALFKAKYIKDKTDKRNEYRRVLKQDFENSGYIPPRENIKFTSNGFENVVELAEFRKENNLIFNEWVELSNKRFFEIEVYIENILSVTDKKNDETEKINYLIDEMFKYHSDILDEPKADLAFRDEINALIFKCLLIRIDEINTTPIMEFSEQFEKAVNKSLKWNAKKAIIGTLFGIMYKTGAIEGYKTDLARALIAMFPNLSESTIKGNLDFKTNELEAKQQYDTQTVNLLQNFSEYLKNSTT